MSNLPFLTESAKDFVETETVGSYRSSFDKNSFDATFEAAATHMLEAGYDVKQDLSAMIKHPGVMQQYKDECLAQLFEEAENEDAEATCSHARNCYEAVSALWDNTVDDFITETQTVSALMPIKTLDLPIIIKSHIKAAAKDIIQTEVAKSPVIKKQIERQYVVDYKNNKKWEFPRCFFDGTFHEFFEAGSGVKIEDLDALTLPVANYDIIDELAKKDKPVTKGHDKLSYDIAIVSFNDGTSDYPCNLTFSITDGRLNGGKLSWKNTSEEPKEDLLMGQVDFTTGIVNVASCAGEVKSIKLGGYISNENNERSVSLEYAREQIEWEIKDGFRMNVPYTLEQLQDAKALIDIDLYKKSYDNIAEIHTQLEDSEILKFLDEEFERWKGVEVDMLDFTSWVKEAEFDCDHSAYNTVVVPSEYIEKELKFKIDRVVIDLADSAKIENMTFVLYGNPRYISLLGKNVNWVVRSGDSLGGVRLNYSYGVMTTGDVKIQVISAAKIPSKKKGEANNKLRIIPFPISPELFTFKHYKYSMHILTTANSGYRHPEYPGGTYTNIMAVNRNKTVAVQGIQCDLTLKNSGFAE